MTAASSYINPALIAQAIAAQGAGADGRTVLTGSALTSVLNALSGVTATPGGMSSYTTDGGDSGNGVTSSYYAPGSYTDSAGDQLYGLLGQQDASAVGGYATQADYDAAVQKQAIAMGLDPTKQYVTSSFDNPTGNGSKDQAEGVYTLDANGNAVPVAASNTYAPGSWVDAGRQAATAMGAVLGGGLLAGYAGVGAAGTGTGAATTGTGVGSTALGTGASDSVAANVGAQLGAADAAGVAPAYGGVGTAGAGAGTDAVVDGSAGLGAAAPSVTAPTVGSAASQVIPGISNGQLLTTGAGLLGAAAGAAKGLNSATTTAQNTVNPALAPYLYGSGGLLSDAAATLATQYNGGTGLNATQQTGLNSQLAALNDPAYAAGLNAMRTTGTGLLSTPQAANPFTSGAASLNPQQNSQIQTQAGAPPGWQPMATQLNPKPGMSTGLLGNTRSFGA